MLYWRFHFEKDNPINCLLAQWKWTYILDFEPWKWSALDLGYMDKRPSRMQGQFYFSKLDKAGNNFRSGSKISLITTDTTLDLTQKAQKVMPLHSSISHFEPLSPPYLTSWDVWDNQVQLLFSTFQYSCTSSHNTPWTSLCNPSAFPTLAHYPVNCHLHAQTLKGNCVLVFVVV